MEIKSLTEMREISITNWQIKNWSVLRRVEVFLYYCSSTFILGYAESCFYRSFANSERNTSLKSEGSPMNVTPSGKLQRSILSFFYIGTRRFPAASEPSLMPKQGEFAANG